MGTILYLQHRLEGVHGVRGIVVDHLELDAAAKEVRTLYAEAITARGLADYGLASVKFRQMLPFVRKLEEAGRCIGPKGLSEQLVLRAIELVESSARVACNA